MFCKFCNWISEKKYSKYDETESAYCITYVTHNTPWAYLRTKDNFDRPIFGRGGAYIRGVLYSGGKTLQFAIC